VKYLGYIQVWVSLDSVVLKTKSEEQLAEYHFLNGLKSLLRADLLGAAAIVGYILSLPLETRPDLATFVLLAFGLLAIFSRKILRTRLGRLDYFVIAMVIAATGISTLFSVDPARSLRFLVYLCLNMFLLWLAAAMVSSRAVRLVAGCLGLFGVLHLVALLAASQIADPATADSLIRHPQMATLIVPNDALILGLCLPSLAFFILTSDVRKPLVPYIAVALYVAFSVYVSYRLQSKLTLLSFAAALIALAASRVMFSRGEKLEKHRTSVMITIFGLLLLLSAAIWYLGNQSTTRLSLWSVAGTAHTTSSEVLFGSGPNTFLYNPTAIESEFEKGKLVIPWVHNLYLEAYYDQGLFGLLGILALTIIPLTRVLRIEDHSVRAMLMASMITFCLLALFEITLTRRFYFAFLAIMYGLSKAHTSEAKR
jgi:hypothetical protein